jgi:hypothetical protein
MYLGAMVQLQLRTCGISGCALFAALQLAAQQGPPVAWQLSHGESYTEQVEGLWATGDGGYVVAGSVFVTDSVGPILVGDWDVRLWKVDAQGTVQWERTYGGSDADKAMAVVGGAAGGYRVAGHTSSVDGDVSGALGGGDVWVLELDADGMLLGQRCYGGSGTDEAWDMAATADGGCVLVGHSNSTDGEVEPTAGVQDYWVLRLDAAGDIVWQHTYGGALNDEAWAVVVAPDGGCYVAGSTRSLDGDLGGSAGEEDFGVLRLSAAGELLWQRSLGGSSIDLATAIALRAGGGCVVGGVTYSSDGDVTEHGGMGDGWLVALDAAGVLQWERSYGDARANVVIDLCPGHGGGYVGVGTDADSPQLDLWLQRVDEAGTVQWEAVYGGSGDDQGRRVRATSDGGYVLGGHSYSNDGDVGSNNGLQDLWLVKLGVDAIGIAEAGTALPAVQLRVDGRRVWLRTAEPVSGEVVLYDAQGHLLRQLPMRGAELEVDLSGLAAGGYVINLVADGQRRSVPVVLR